MIDVRLAGRYRLENELGAGGMTTVWQAVDEVLERRVAVQILHRHLLSNDVFCTQFRQEALAAGALIHPNIVSVYDTGSHDEAPYVVMEFLGGGSLAQLLEREGPQPPRKVAAVGADVCDALAYAHRAGVVHRDLNPGNILFTPAGQVKVTDFGVARAALGGDLTATGALIGTLSFLAPEVLEGEEATPAADMYALGVVLFKALTGRSPRVGDLPPVTKGRFQAAHPRDFRPDVPRDLDAAVARALSASPGDRFADAAEMGRLLRSVTQTKAVRAPEPVAPPKPPPTPSPEETSFVKSEARWLAPLVLLILTAIAVVIGVLQLSGNLPPLTHNASPPAPKIAEQGTMAMTGGGSYDPAPGDNSEHPELVGAAFDNNPSTSWRTETYNQDFGTSGSKSGVGVFGDLGKAAALKRIQVDTPAGGWQATIRTSDDGQNWSAPGPNETVDGGQHSFNVASAGSHRYWMVWVTKLVPIQGGFQASISEIKAFG